MAKQIHARRIAGNLYDCTYSDGRDQDRSTWSDVVQCAKTWNYSSVHINNEHRGEDEPKTFTVAAKDLTPHGWSHLLLEKQEGCFNREKKAPAK